jgi:hypothetical protein
MFRPEDSQCVGSAGDRTVSGQRRDGSLAGEQRQFQQMDDAITNTAHFVAADGQHYDLDARYRYQWRAPDGHTVGTNTSTAPSPGSTQLERLPE